MPDYKKSFKRPFLDMRKFGIGSFLYMIPFVNIITGFLVSGYTLECAKKAMEKKYNLPEWHNWGDLFTKGILAFVISMIYFVPAFVLAYLFGGTDLLLSVTGIVPAAEFKAAFLVPMLFVVLGVYFVPYALMRFIDHNFKAAFKVIEIGEKVFTPKYFVPWLVALVYSGIVITAAYMLNFYLEFTIVLPFVITAIALFITGVTSMSIIGAAYSEVEKAYFNFKF